MKNGSNKCYTASEAALASAVYHRTEVRLGTAGEFPWAERKFLHRAVLHACLSRGSEVFIPGPVRWKGRTQKEKKVEVSKVGASDPRANRVRLLQGREVLGVRLPGACSAAPSLINRDFSTFDTRNIRIVKAWSPYYARHQQRS